MSRVILVTGATGQQGGAVINALLNESNQNFTILAVTRDTTSGSSQKLAAKSSSIKLVQGNLDDVPGIFAAAKEVVKEPIWGAYSVQISMGKGVTFDGEITQGKAMIDESIKNNVKHFVYSSVDRGGDEKSWDNETPIPHFQTKYQIDRYLRDTAGSMGWTILRPVAFMDNLQPGFPTKVFMAALSNNLGEKPLQWIATKDIGIFAAKAFANPEKYNKQAVSLAGDNLTVEGLTEAFGKATGAPVVPTYGILGSVLTTMVGEMGTMVRWFGSDGYGADTNKLKTMHPGLLNMESWIKEESKFPKAS
ncbi:hypothetical protein BLS_003720 [Venturia inaequalis]|uniref:NmrA-like domain-containing protein n=1 Tax=Venturia inaequalis TaxID=5025 RepID=A0A8H3URR5_VENIN|nr:hypothetical protein BLS_003720 [Venturia inaequalis]KAE9974151.1 hypothetical protein EG328_004011 [Venturia inaequalis]KAE9994823.1 hypothetical protein EG327_000036 [Venturia inaequalis]RDI83802.1 hypothetical protein Vi05172_g6155 [Venturia inaequalis]